MFQKGSPKCDNIQNANFETPIKRMKPTEIKGRILDFDSSGTIYYSYYTFI